MPDSMPENSTHEVVVHEHRNIPAQQPPRMDITKALLMTLVSCMLTGVGAWLTFGANRVSRDELDKALETSGPYARDRQLVMDGIASAKSKNESNATQLQSLLIEQTRLTAKIDTLVNEISGLRLDLRKSSALKFEDKPGGN